MTSTALHTCFHGYAILVRHAVQKVSCFKPASYFQISEHLCRHVSDYRWFHIQIYPQQGQKKSCRLRLVVTRLYTVVGTLATDFEDVSLAIWSTSCLQVVKLSKRFSRASGFFTIFFLQTLCWILYLSNVLFFILEGFVLANTAANSDWVVRNFKSWADWRTAQDPDDPVPSDILTSGDTVALNKWLSLYVIETRKQNGQRYPASTLNLLLC